MMLPAILLSAVISAGCNSEKDSEPDYESAISVAVTKFSLSPNARVMTNLDSVYFSIDLERGIIFNADSLPMGTNISKLVPVITYPSTVTSAIIEMKGGSLRTGTIDYVKSPTDTVDFTGDVTLTLATSDNLLSRSYIIKVNVHKSVPDSLMWDKNAISPLPSRKPSPRGQKSVVCNNKVICMIEESDNSLTLSSNANPSKNNWMRTLIVPGFSPRIRTLTSNGSSLFILSENGSLMISSDDGENWSDTGRRWYNIIGNFGNEILGISEDSSNQYLFDRYPRPVEFEPTILDNDFPIDDISNFSTLTTKWTPEPIGFFCGGRRRGEISDVTWAYDGVQWGNISNRPLPPLTDCLIIPYYNYRKTSASWIQTEYNVWLCIGGRYADNSINNDVYISYDNGVNWAKADSLLQLPAYVAAGYSADALVITSPMDAQLDAYWREYPSKTPAGVKRINYFVDGTEVEWNCPYIYRFGGYDVAGNLRNEIWRAVLARLTYAPLF